MALIYRDRVRQKASPAGTGNVTLGAAVDSYITFAQANLSTNSFPYAIINSTQFEVGVGTFSGGVLYRTLVLSTSNNDTNLVNFNGSLADVIITNAAELSVLTSTQPVSNTKKFIKWINSEFVLVDPVVNAPSLGAGIQSSVIYYESDSASFEASQDFKFYPGALPEVYVNGVVQAIAKAFKIQHPKKQNKFLNHGCLEGPEYGIYFRGEIELKGRSAVFLPEYFSAISKNYTVSVSSSSFCPVKIQKHESCFEIIPLIPFIKIKLDFLVVASRIDVPFQLETDV